MKIVRSFDKHVAKQIARLPASLHRPFDWLGNATTPFMWSIALVLYNLATYSGEFKASVLVLLLMPLATISKFLFRRQRPPTIYAGNMRIKSYSFPSSHAYAAALASGFFTTVCLASGYPLLSLVFASLVIIIGVSRAYLGAHYPSDVLAGWLFGFLLLGASIAWL